MATRIRLRRVGRRNQPEFRIVVAHRTASRDGAFVEAIGHYNPRTSPETLAVDVDKARQWLDRGATPSDTVRSLLKRAGVFTQSGEAPSETAASESPASSAPPPSEG